MKTQSTAALLFLASSANAFAPLPQHQQPSMKLASTMDPSQALFFVDVVEEEKQAPKPKPMPKKKAPAHKEGLFSPMVLLAKDILGDETLNKVRGNAINLHSTAIKSFVETADSAFGNTVLRSLFLVADKNGNGQIELDELERALQTLGFRWLQEKQMKGIFERAGGAEKGFITLEEFLAEAPKTLKTNLVKLAKTNGGDLGFLV